MYVPISACVFINVHLYMCVEKYEGLHEQCVKNGWSKDMFPLEIGCQDFISNSISTFLTKLGLSSAEKREYIKRRSKTRL